MSYRFFLGGHDLEMVTIGEFLRECGVPFHDKQLGWDARASAYRGEIEAALARGETPVFVELHLDLDVPGKHVVSWTITGSAPVPTSLRRCAKCSAS